MQNKDIIKEQNELAEKLLATHILTPENAVFKATPGGFASLTFEEETYHRVNVFRLFPFSLPEQYISVRGGEKNEEIGIIESLSAFDQATRDLLNRQLSLRYFMPKIQKIITIKEEHGYSYWRVVTDHGECKFTCDQNGVTKLADTRLLIVDLEGNRFELPDATALSAKELRMVDLYM